MAKLAVQGEPRFEVSDAEVKRGGRSYTVDTLAELSRTYPSDEMFLILGWTRRACFAPGMSQSEWESLPHW